jgi:hypothetical protein
MYWLVLPLDANAQRHLVAETGRANDFWVHLWVRLQGAFGRVSSPERF